MGDIIDTLINEARGFADRRVANILKNADRIREFEEIGKIFTEALPTCIVSLSNHEYSPLISVFLHGDTDVMSVVEVLHDNAERINAFGMADEYTSSIDGNSRTVDFSWNALAIYVHVNGGNCKLVVESTELVEKHKYKVECL